MLFRHLPSLNRHLALRLALGLALASALPQSVSGQVGLTRGDHVRVRFGNEHAYGFGDLKETSISGEVVSTLGGELVLRHSERLTRIPLSGVRSIKKRTGRRAPSVPDMVASSTVGFGIGFRAGVLLEAAAGRNTWPEAETTAAAGMTTGMFIGIPLGVLRDLMTSKGGALYEPVDIRGVRPSLSRTRHGGLGLSFTAATR